MFVIVRSKAGGWVAGPMTQVEARIQDAGLTLPAAPPPAAAYVPYSIAGDTIYVAGQIPVVDGEVIAKGKIGEHDGDLESGYATARICALNVIAVLKEAAESVGKTLDDLRVVRLSGFVNAAPGFTDIHLVTNGASELIAEAFATDGIHARSAVGMAELPLGVPFELEAIAQIK